MLRVDQFSKELVEGICNVLKDNVISIIVYGSVARGMQTDESDIDVALIIKNGLDSDSEDKLSDVVVDLNLKYDKVFSVIDIDGKEFEKWGETSPFYRNVKKEGIVIWKAA